MTNIWSTVEGGLISDFEGAVKRQINYDELFLKDLGISSEHIINTLKGGLLNDLGYTNEDIIKFFEQGLLQDFSQISSAFNASTAPPKSEPSTSDANLGQYFALGLLGIFVLLAYEYMGRDKKNE
ncbi:MAG: hypothetical protein QXV17_10790 [Candidatus Micrarchaeaceae archaeon]